MADIWISLLGSNATADGSPQLPYRDFSFAFSVHKGNNRYIFSNAGGTPTSVFQEDDVLTIIAEENVQLFTQTPGTVFLRLEALDIRNSSVKIQNLFASPLSAAPLVFLHARDSEVTLGSTTLFDVACAGAVKVERSRLDVYASKITGAGANLLLDLDTNCRLHVEGLTLDGTYTKALAAATLLEMWGSRLAIEGNFSEAGALYFGGSDNLRCQFEDLTISGRTVSLGTPPAGLIIDGLSNLEETNYIRRVLAQALDEALVISGSTMMVDKATLSTNTVGIRASQDSNVLLRNSVLDHNALALDADLNATLTYDYCDLYENAEDFVEPFRRLTTPEEFRIFLELEFELANRNIKAGSERVYPVSSPSTVYQRNIDYVIDYGNNFEAGSLKRIPSGAIPDGQYVAITYEYPSGATITGFVVPGARIRRVDPGYVNYEGGDLHLADHSPLVDGGIYTGFSFMGTNPDMGYWERTRALSTEEAVLHLNLKSRNDDVLLPPDIANTIRLQEQNLLAYNSRLDVSEGSAIRDLMIKPVAQLQDPIRLQLNLLLGQQSIEFYETLTERDMDLLAANLFLTRHPGNYATGPVRLRFSGVPGSVVVPAGTQFVTGDGLNFYTMREQIFLADEIVFNRDGEYYYVDVQVQAEALGAGYSVARETIRAVLNYNNVYLYDVYNPFAMANGVDRESNTELYERMQNALSVRTLVNRRAVNTVLREQFRSIVHLTLIGAGDPEMTRDIIPELRTYIGDRHIHGLMDLYVSFPELTTVSQDYDLDDLARCYINKYNTSNMPLIYVRKAELLDSENTPIRELLRSEYDLLCAAEHMRFSYEESLTFQMVDVQSYAGMRVRLTWDTSPLIRSIQDYVNQDDTRVCCTDILVKHYIPKILHMTIDYKTDLPDDISVNIVEGVKDFLVQAAPGEALSLSKLSIPIINNGAKSFSTPLTVNVETWMQTGHTAVHTTDDEIPLSRIEHVIAGTVAAEKMA